MYIHVSFQYFVLFIFLPHFAHACVATCGNMCIILHIWLHDVTMLHTLICYYLYHYTERVGVITISITSVQHAERGRLLAAAAPRQGVEALRQV